MLSMATGSGVGLEGAAEGLMSGTVLLMESRLLTEEELAGLT